MTVTDRWTSGADYDQWMGRWSRLLAHEFLAWLALPAGLRWLDICCGSGVVTEAILERNAPASIAGVDVSPEQIKFARHHRARPNVTFLTADAIALPFPASSFDVAVCGLGLNYIPHPIEGLNEFRRVTSPGATIAAYVWDYAHGAQFLRAFWNAALAVDAEASVFDQARRFPICGEGGLLSIFQRAGLSGLSVRAIEIVTGFTSFDDYWHPLLTGQGSAPGYLATRSEEIKSAIRDRLRSTLPASDGTITLPARAWAVRGRS
jgi:SAM-dependent methyltransferase